MKVSVVIATYNNRDRLELALKGLEMQDFDKNEFEVLVVNDGSTDDTSEFLESCQLQLQLTVINQPNQSQAAARNTGIEHASGELVIFIDDDIFCSKDFVSKYYEDYSNAPEPSVVIGNIRNISAGRFEEAKKMIRRSEYADTGVLEQFIEQDSYFDMRTQIWDENYTHLKWTCLTGNNAAVPKSVLKKSGNFDPNFKGWGPEDVELGYRIANKGVDFLYDREINGYHLDKPKKKGRFYSKLARNLRYLRDEKYKGDSKIRSFVLFIGGNISLEEFNQVCSGSEAPFTPSENKKQFYFPLVKYFTDKSDDDN